MAPNCASCALQCQAAHRGHMGRIGAKKKKTSLAITHTKPQAHHATPALATPALVVPSWPPRGPAEHPHGLIMAPS